MEDKLRGLFALHYPRKHMSDYLGIQKSNTADGLIVVRIGDPVLVDQLEKVGIDLLGRCILRGLVQAVEKLPDVSEIGLSRMDAISSHLQFVFNSL